MGPVSCSSAATYSCKPSELLANSQHVPVDLPTPHLALFRKSRQCRRKRRVASAKEQSSRHDIRVLEPNPPQYPESTRKFTAAGWLAAFSIVSLAGVIINRLLQQRRQERDFERVEAQDEFLHENNLESEEFKGVLSSVRQSVTFQRAVQSMRTGDTARAMVELYRVLEQNAICRTPLTISSFSGEELEDIYRLHLHNSELPLQYSTLLHLRQLLQLSDKRAEELEAELKAGAYEFSI